MKSGEGGEGVESRKSVRGRIYGLRSVNRESVPTSGVSGTAVAVQGLTVLVHLYCMHENSSLIRIFSW